MSDSIMQSELKKKQEIRKVIEGLLLRIESPYKVTHYPQEFHSHCCKVARERGYPMGSDSSIPSLLPFIPTGVTIAFISYRSIEDEATRVFIALYTAFLTYVDDTFMRDNQRILAFVDRFIRRDKQMDPVLDGLASFLLEIPDYYEPVVGNVILTGALSMINSTMLDLQTQGMKTSLYAKNYPDFTRRMSGAANAYALMAFPRTIPIRSYIWCIHEAANFVNYSNDVLSFYKEEIGHETANYISVLARCSGTPKMKAFSQLANDVAEAHEQVCRILEADQEAYKAWQKFKDGYVEFHTSSERYLFDDLMN